MLLRRGHTCNAAIASFWLLPVIVGLRLKQDARHVMERVSVVLDDPVLVEQVAELIHPPVVFGLAAQAGVQIGWRTGSRVRRCPPRKLRSEAGGQAHPQGMLRTRPPS